METKNQVLDGDLWGEYQKTLAKARTGDWVLISINVYGAITFLMDVFLLFRKQ